MLVEPQEVIGTVQRAYAATRQEAEQQAEETHVQTVMERVRTQLRNAEEPPSPLSELLPPVLQRTICSFATDSSAGSPPTPAPSDSQLAATPRPLPVRVSRPSASSIDEWGGSLDQLLPARAAASTSRTPTSPHGRTPPAPQTSRLSSRRSLLRQRQEEEAMSEFGGSLADIMTQPSLSWRQRWLQDAAREAASAAASRAQQQDNASIAAATRTAWADGESGEASCVQPYDSMPGPAPVSNPSSGDGDSSDASAAEQSGERERPGMSEVAATESMQTEAERSASGAADPVISAAGFAGGLSDVFPPQLHSARQRPAPLHFEEVGESAPSQQAAALRQPHTRRPVSVDDFGGSLGDILQPYRRRLSSAGTSRHRAADVDAAEASGSAAAPASVRPGTADTVAASLDEWQGSLGEILPPRSQFRTRTAQRASAPPQGRPLGGGMRVYRPTMAQRSGGTMGSGRGAASMQNAQPGDAATELDYDRLMQMHLRDNPPPHAAPVMDGGQIARAALQHASPEEAQGNACSICLDGFEQPSPSADGPCIFKSGPTRSVCKLPCAHLFHGRCIREWLKHDVRCPLCRLDLVNAVASMPGGVMAAMQRTAAGELS